MFFKTDVKSILTRVDAGGTEQMLRVEGVEKSFGDFKAVDGVDLSVEKGELVAVIGPNGAGKTTLFNLITGQLKPDHGRILFKEKNIIKLPPYQICKMGIARSFQIVNIFPRLNVFENVQVAVLSQQGKTLKLINPARKLAVEETLEILRNLNLSKKAESLAGSLSHGDQKILEIAIALGGKPELLILDEPTAGMSPEETSVIIKLIKELSKELGITILFCEHDMDVVFSITNSIMVMHQGRTLIQGRPDEVRRNDQVQEAYLGDA
jgi:branched-chain amino acid transport system ATP-binding protein